MILRKDMIRQGLRVLKNMHKNYKVKYLLMLWKKEEMLMDSNIAAYANKFRKGGLGNLLEEVYFGYKANSEQEADFP